MTSHQKTKRVPVNPKNAAITSEMFKYMFAYVVIAQEIAERADALFDDIDRSRITTDGPTFKNTVESIYNRCLQLIKTIDEAIDLEKKVPYEHGMIPLKIMKRQAEKALKNTENCIELSKIDEAADENEDYAGYIIPEALRMLSRDSSGISGLLNGALNSSSAFFYRHNYHVFCMRSAS